MSRFNYKWLYRKGANNVADPISRSPALLLQAQFARLQVSHTSDARYRKGTSSTSDPISRNPALMIHACLPMGRCRRGGRNSLEQQRLRVEQEAHASLLPEIRAAYAADETFDGNNYGELQDGVYHIGHRIIIPQGEDLRTKLIRLAHDEPFSGHKGISRTIHLLQRNFHWKNMRKDVRDYIASCESCQRHKVPRTRPGGLLQPVEIPDRPWECVTMDFITCLPTTPCGNDALLVFVDKLTKMTHLVPCNLKINAQQAAEAFRDHVWKYHGLPKKIISDRDGRFTGNFMDALATALGVRQALSTSFHPQTDGQTEIMNQIVEDTLRHYVSPTQEDWDEWIVAVEFAINNSYQETVRSTPFRLNYGQDPLTPPTVELPLRGPAARKWLEQNTQMIERARYFAKCAQDRQKAYADDRRRPVDYQLNQWIMLSSKNLKFKLGGTKKLLPKFIGPFKIIQLIGNGENPERSASAVKLQLPRTCKIHPVFHVSLLKPYVSRDGTEPRTPELSVDADGVPVFEVDRIVDEKEMTISRQRKRCFLLRWKGYSELDDTWEVEDDILSPSLIQEWRKTHPGPAPKGRAQRIAISNIAPVTAQRPLTRNEARRLEALRNVDIADLPAVTVAQLIHWKTPKAVRRLASTHPTLAALTYWETLREEPTATAQQDADAVADIASQAPAVDHHSGRRSQLRTPPAEPGTVSRNHPRYQHPAAPALRRPKQQVRWADWAQNQRKR